MRKQYTSPIAMLKLGPRLARITETTTLFGVTIPAGYEVDGATVPRPLWWILSPFTEGFRAAIVHDYAHHPHMTWEERKRADYLFFRHLQQDDVSWLRSTLAWLGVRGYAYVRWQSFKRG